MIIIMFLLSKQTVTNKVIVKEDAQQEGKKGIAHTKSNLPIPDK
jgi:hypothetical protein